MQLHKALISYNTTKYNRTKHCLKKIYCRANRTPGVATVAHQVSPSRSHEDFCDFTVWVQQVEDKEFRIAMVHFPHFTPISCMPLHCEIQDHVKAVLQGGQTTSNSKGKHIQ